MRRFEQLGKRCGSSGPRSQRRDAVRGNEIELVEDDEIGMDSCRPIVSPTYRSSTCSLIELPSATTTTFPNHERRKQRHRTRNTAGHRNTARLDEHAIRRRRTLRQRDQTTPAEFVRQFRDDGPVWIAMARELGLSLD